MKRDIDKEIRLTKNLIDKTNDPEQKELLKANLDRLNKSKNRQFGQTEEGKFIKKLRDRQKELNKRK